MIIPPYLKKGDTIGLVAPSGFMPIEKMQACIETLDGWGYTVAMGNTTHSNSSTYFSGTDEERLADLQEMMDNPDIKAILCARGGYGMSRIIDKLSFKRFRKQPKWIIGYSDITVLHAHLDAKYRVASLHAPMAAAFNDGEAGNVYIASIKNALEGIKAEYECPVNVLNRAGYATGELVGGNLTLLAHIVGTSSDFKTKNKLLFLEDVSEYQYNIDRMFHQLKRAGKLDKLAGLIIGGFTDTKDTERPFGQPVYEMIYDAVKEYHFPVCFGFPVSHDKANYALKVGATYSLDIQLQTVSLKEE